MTDVVATSQNWIEGAKLVALTYAVPVGGKIVGAILLWIVGSWVIRLIRRLTKHALDVRKLDPTLVRYLDSVLGAVLSIILGIGVLSIFGVETTSLAGILAAAGIAIGMAWSGLLSNFAAGVFMILLRPFKVGDFVTIAGITGTVHEIGLFATTLDPPDNVRTFIGNAKVFGDVIRNYSTNPYRAVDLRAQLVAGVDVKEAAEKLHARIAKIPHVLKDPAPVIQVIELTAAGPLLVVRPFCHTDHYWDVHFDTFQVVYDTFKEAGYPAAPVQQISIRDHESRHKAA
jgi:small conductance mechanosensitive channel